MKTTKRVGIIILAFLLLTPFMASSAGATISFTCAVVLSDNSPVVGATVEMVGNSSLSTTTESGGTFTLAGLPIGAPFSVKISKDEYADIYSAMMRSDADIDSTGRPFGLFTSGEVLGWGVTAGKGVIKTRVRNKADGTPIGGATVSCASAQGKNYTIVYVNEAGALDSSATSTSSNGKFFILNVEEGDQVYVTAEKTGWAFDGRVFMTHADSVSESPVFGTQNADKVAIHTRLKAAIDAYNSQNLNGFMAYISENYLDDGMDKAACSAEVQEDMNDPDFEPISYMILNTTVDGSAATVDLIWAYGELETMHFIKENEITWMLYGNQKKYVVEARSQNWHSGQQYMVHFKVEDPNHTATSVTITGPGITGSLSLDWDTNENKWNSWHTNKSVDFGSNHPTPPLTYTFIIVDSSGTTIDTSTIRSFVSVYATNLSTSGAGTATDPLVFSWTGAGSGYTYQVQLSDVNWTRIWDSDWGLIGTSVSYDGPSLTPDAQYHYWVVVEDEYENSSFAEGSFTYQSTQPAAGPGDVDGNGAVALADAILALKVIAGMTPVGVNLSADVNNDGKIGLAEVIYILQYVAGLRQDFTPFSPFGIWTGTISSSNSGSGTVENWELKQDYTMNGNWIFNSEGGVVVSLAVGGGYSYNNNQMSFTTTGTATMSGAGSGTSGYTLTVQGSLTSDTEASGTYSIDFTEPGWTDNTGNWSVTKG